MRHDGTWPTEWRQRELAAVGRTTLDAVACRMAQDLRRAASPFVSRKVLFLPTLDCYDVVMLTPAWTSAAAGATAVLGCEGELPAWLARHGRGWRYDGL